MIVLAKYYEYIINVDIKYGFLMLSVCVILSV